ncbi:hypothetical protein DPMN_125823 [Dreissena polymorpha]|uniref:Tyrosinase copper-binding domain-containing protein n=2 Tax=Dreissena polymorpha TaxID=45954 RepID=A0A9D4GYF4_DREPO|nr:hypothetical protein DPMN_125823 [Dreissena polymorpha]
MGNVAQAAYDPVFFMHHAFIDYIWEQFRWRQSSLMCQVNVENDYREQGDYAVNNAPGHAPWEEMHGFEYLQNRDGLWRNWTTAVYGYEPVPKCPECGNSDNLYCDMDVDPRRPDGVCVTKTKFFCVDAPLTVFDRDKPFEDPLGGGVTVILGTIHKGLPGDRRTRFMSQKEGLAILRQQVGHVTPLLQPILHDVQASQAYKKTLNINLHEEVYVVSSADPEGALVKHEDIVRGLVTTVATILACML